MHLEGRGCGPGRQAWQSTHWGLPGRPEAAAGMCWCLSLQAFPLLVPLRLLCRGPMAARSGRGLWPKTWPSWSVLCPGHGAARRLLPASLWADLVLSLRSTSSQVGQAQPCDLEGGWMGRKLTGRASKWKSCTSAASLHCVCHLPLHLAGGLSPTGSQMSPAVG